MSRYLNSNKNDTIEELQLVIRILTQISAFYFTESVERGLGNGSRIEVDGMLFDVWLEDGHVKIGLTEDGQDSNHIP